MAPTEEWRTIPSHPDYQASSLGRIRSHRRKKTRLMSASPTGSYYLAVCLRTDNSRGKHTMNVHALVAEAFFGPRPEGLEVRHLNGDSRDNRAENLEYATHSENLRDRARHGTDPNRAKTRCPSDHVYDEANTYWRQSGARSCRACNRERARARAAGIEAA
jgi:hypothetical protein